LSKTLRPLIYAGALLFGLWFLLTGSRDPQELIVGAVVSVVIALVALRSLTELTECRGAVPRRIGYLLLYVPYLLKAIILANIDVAGRVINPSLPIRPGIVRVKTRLKSPLGRLFLTSSITLTPGTLTVDMVGDDLYIHWIDVEAEGIEAASHRIVAGFERYLEVIFG